jgi:hypothetical protein
VTDGNARIASKHAKKWRILLEPRTVRASDFDVVTRLLKALIMLGNA